VENKRIVPIWVSVILTVLLVISIMLQMTVTFKYADSVLFTAVTLIDCIASILALIYCFKGYSKNAAGFFKAFCVIYCLSFMLPIFSVAEFYKADNILLIISLILHLVNFQY